MRTGLLLVILASALFGSFPSLQKYVLVSGVTPITLVIICNGVACLTSLAISIIRKKSIRVRKDQLISLALIGVVGLFLTDYLLDLAYLLIPVGYVTMIHFMYPALVCLFMTLLFRAKMNWMKIAAIVLSVVGLALLAGGGFSGSLSGIVIAALTAGTYAFYMIATDKTPAGEVDPLIRVFYTNLFVCVAGLVCSSKMDVSLPKTPSLWGCSILIGFLLCMAIMLINMGVQKLGAGIASFVNMVEPVTSLVVSFLVYHYSIGVFSVIGCVLILGSLIFAAKGGD